MRIKIYPGLGETQAAAELHARCFPSEPWSSQELEKLLSMPGSLAWHVRNAEKAFGFLLARQAGEEAEVLTVAVNTTFRRRGLGKLMMMTLMDDLHRRGVGVLYLEMARNNGSAAALYSSLGFSSVGIRKDYYRDGADAVIMRLAIDKIAETNSSKGART